VRGRPEKEVRVIERGVFAAVVVGALLAPACAASDRAHGAAAPGPSVVASAASHGESAGPKSPVEFRPLDAQPSPPAASPAAGGAPTLVYGRPDGVYAGPEADRVILDFHVANAELGEGKYTVHAYVKPPVGPSKGITITSAKSFEIANLPDGASVVRLELRDPDGVIVPGPSNVVERSITVDRSAAKSRP
jgi:hypothetical protein